MSSEVLVRSHVSVASCFVCVFFFVLFFKSSPTVSPVNEFKCIVHWMVRQSQKSVHLLLSALRSNESSEDDAR